jgi:acyl transferase domain-containing protein
LAQLFVQSCDLDWAELYQAEDHRRLSLPTYPFAREYFWVPQSAKQEAASVGSGAFNLKACVASDSSNLDEQRFTTRVTGDDFFVRDHQIEHRKVLPGVVYLELARAAAELAGGQKTATLRNVVWMKPLNVETKARELSVNLHQRDDATIYDVSFTTESQQRVSLAQGELIKRQNVTRDRVDLDEIRNRCVRFVSGDSCYEEFRSHGFHYGPSFRVIQELSYNQNEVLACLALPAARSDELKQFVLHPSLLDGALQAGLWLIDRETLAESRYLPFAVAEVQINEPSLPPICYVHVSESSRKAHLRKFRVRILDESGNVLVELRDYAARAQRHTATREVTLELITHPFEGRTRMPARTISDDLIGDVFRKVEAGELDVNNAQLLIQQLATTPAFANVQAAALAPLNSQ